MALKDVLVLLDAGPRSDMRLGVAAALARRYGAHLTGLFVVEIPESAFLYGTTMPYGIAAPDLVADTRAELMERAKPVEARFRDVAARNGLESEWRMAEGVTASVLAQHAHYSDLVVVGQPESGDGGHGHEVVATTLMSGGRPVLVVPWAGEFTDIGSRVLVAWNASKEATRAVHDAMPLLEQAKAVTVLAINPRNGIGDEGELPAADIALHLARHGVKAEAAHTVTQDISEGDALLSYAADASADLIVAGGYGHSRARELVFGGVTRSLLRAMTVPVLLSH